MATSTYKKVIAELLHYLEVEIPSIISRYEGTEKQEEKDFNVGR